MILVWPMRALHPPGHDLFRDGQVTQAQPMRTVPQKGVFLLGLLSWQEISLERLGVTNWGNPAWVKADTEKPELRRWGGAERNSCQHHLNS